MKKYDFSQILEILMKIFKNFMCLRKKKTLLSALFIAQKQNILHFPLFFFATEKVTAVCFREGFTKKSLI